MTNPFETLRSKQLDRHLTLFQAARSVTRPAKGWIRAIRQASGLSAAALARILGTSRQLPLQLEKAEVSDTITLGSLRKVANAMDCELVYALVPRHGSVQQLQEQRAIRQARANVLHVEHSMALEDQAAGGIDEAVEAEADRLQRPSAR